MVSTVDNDRGRRPAGRRDAPAAAAGERQRAFRSARRHSLVVTSMRYVLPVTALAVAGIYGAVVVHRSGWIGGLPDVAPPRIVPENLTMDNPRYNGFMPDGGTYVVTAATAQQDLKDTNKIRLNAITGVMTDPDATRTDLKARRGLFDSAANTLDLLDEVDVVTTTGMRAKLKNATIEIKENVVTSNDPVYVEMTAGTVRSERMRLRHKVREVTFTGNVKTHLNAPPDSAAKPEGAAAAPLPTPAEAKRPFGGSSGPIDVTSNRLDVNDLSKLAVFSGGVTARQGEATLTSPDLHVAYVGSAPGMPGAKEAADAAAIAAASPQGKVQRITATGPVVMTQATGERVTSDSADFDTVNDRAYLNGNVVMTALPDRRAAGDKAEVDQKADTVLLVGNVSVVQGKNELSGARLASDRKSGKTRLTAAPEDGGAGRITAKFVRGAAQAGAGQAAPAVAAKPAAGGAFGATFRTNPNAPIDVESDTLDIDDTRKQATFLGNVMARQGDFTVRTVEMVAFYSGAAGLGPADPQATAKGGQPAADLTRIEARRQVVVQSRDGQTASGDWATFDTKRNTVTVGGDVTLTQGPNVVRGSKLTIDMATGESVIETDPKAAWSARAQPTYAGDVKGTPIEVPAVNGRPSAVFYPKRLNEKSRPDAPAAAAAKGGAPAGRAGSAAASDGAPATARSAAPNDGWEQLTLPGEFKGN